MKRCLLLVATVTWLLAGCAEPTPSTTPSADTSSTGAATGSQSSAESTTPAPATDQTTTAGGAQDASTAAATDTTSTAPTQQTTQLVPAAVGVGQKGRSLDKYQNDSVQKVISTPAREFFRLRERIVFEIQIPEALNLYKAEHGEAPKSHEQFMTDIIEANQIRLPDLKPGDRYIYDPQTEELMVERHVAQ